MISYKICRGFDDEQEVLQGFLIDQLSQTEVPQFAVSAMNILQCLMVLCLHKGSRAFYTELYLMHQIMLVD